MYRGPYWCFSRVYPFLARARAPFEALQGNAQALATQLRCTLPTLTTFPVTLQRPVRTAVAACVLPVRSVRGSHCHHLRGKRAP